MNITKNKIAKIIGLIIFPNSTPKRIQSLFKGSSKWSLNTLRRINIKLSEDKVEEGKILDFIDLKCGQGWEIKGLDNREMILQTKKVGS